jgi:hypothetical protein
MPTRLAINSTGFKVDRPASSSCLTYLVSRFCDYQWQVLVDDRLRK